jgi:hypothetical protein
MALLSKVFTRLSQSSPNLTVSSEEEACVENWTAIESGEAVSARWIWSGNARATGEATRMKTHRRASIAWECGRSIARRGEVAGALQGFGVLQLLAIYITATDVSCKTNPSSRRLYEE